MPALAMPGRAKQFVRNGNSRTGRARQAPRILAISHATTKDLPNGSPWPPHGDALWCIVARADGCTTWRCVSLNEEETS